MQTNRENSCEKRQGSGTEETTPALSLEHARPIVPLTSFSRRLHYLRAWDRLILLFQTTVEPLPTPISVQRPLFIVPVEIPY